MKNLFLLLICFLTHALLFAQVGKVGINTSSPAAMLHVKDSSVLFSGLVVIPNNPGNPPATGQGARMMWYADKAAFRSGYVTGTQWNKANIGNYSTALGYNTIATGTSSIAAGYSTKATGFISTAFGYNTKAIGFISTAMGAETTAKPFASVALGQFNDTSSISSESWNVLDPIFIIGNGIANDERGNAMTVLKNARTGINIENPLAGLHIKGIEATYDAHIRLETATIGSTDYANILYDGNMKFRTFTAGDEFQWRNSANNVTMTLQDDGDLFIDGILTPNSDRRLKKELEPITNGLDKVLLLQGYHYLWNDPERDPSLQTGVIAQDIEKILPELVKTDVDGMKGVNYIGIIPYLIEACKEQQSIISTQQMRLDTLEKELQELKALVFQMSTSKK